MKKIGSIALGLALLGLASCAKDEPIVGPDNNGSGEKDIYATITINLPSTQNTRVNGDASTEQGQGIYTGDGKEIGQDVENQVGKIILVIADAVKDGEGNITDYQLITYAISDAQQNGMTGPNADKVDYLLNFSSDDLKPEIADDELNGAADLGGKDVYVFAYCNPTTTLEGQIRSVANSATNNRSIVNLGGTVSSTYSETQIWQDNKFLMTNVESHMVTLPNRQEILKHNSPNNPLDLGHLDVYRVVARFDFQSYEDEIDGETVYNTYVIKNTAGGTKIGVVELTDMTAFNISKSYYYLPRTNTEWSWKGLTTYCSGKDNNTNAFVMSTNYDVKSAPKLNSQNLSQYFWAQLNNESSWNTASKWESLKNWHESNKDDNVEGWNHGTSSYKIWRYVPENTIPSWQNESGEYELGSQRAGITTGVVFRAAFTPEDTELWDGNPVYVYKSVIYGNFEKLVEYVKNNEDTEVAAAFKEVEAFTDNMNNYDLSKDYTGGEQVNGFSAYISTGKDAEDKPLYQMYYFYYNRHKSNFDNNKLDVNEFGVVRNNVYKLMVTKVGSLGLPTPPDPNTEDEEEEIYFTVDVRVLPWVVRVNDIEF